MGRLIINLEFSHIEDKYAAIRRTGADLAALRVPTDLENAASALVAVHQLTALGAPDVNAFVKAARRKEFAIGTERHRVHRFRVFGQCMNAHSALYIPQPYGWIERCTCQYQIHVGVLCARPSWRPLDCVDFLRMRLQIMDTIVLFHWPNLEGHVVRTGGQQLTLRIPFDGIHLVGVALERFNGFVHIHFAHVNALIRTAAGERGIALPIDIKGRRQMERELLCTLSGGRIPDNCCTINLHVWINQMQISHRQKKTKRFLYVEYIPQPIECSCLFCSISMRISALCAGPMY